MDRQWTQGVREEKEQRVEDTQWNVQTGYIVKCKEIRGYEGKGEKVTERRKTQKRRLTKRAQKIDKTPVKQNTIGEDEVGTKVTIEKREMMSVKHAHFYMNWTQPSWKVNH